MKKVVFSFALGLVAQSVFAGSMPTITTSIKPVTMVVRAVAGDYATINQIVSNNASPHDFALRPSDLKKINEADFVVWVGESLEGFLEKPLENEGKLDNSIEWLALDDMTIRAFAHEHHHEDDDHDDEHHGEEHDADHHDEDHGHDADHEEGHHGEDHGHDADHEEGHEEHDHNGTDPHVWLNPNNAITLAIQIEKRLANIAPDYAATYKQNLDAFIKDIKAKDKKISKDLQALKGVNYVVFHDGYGYFESHYGLEHAATVTMSPERKPGAKKVAELRHLVEEDKISCFYAEPQFSPAIISSIIEGTSVAVAKLDPLGSDVKMDTNAYGNLLSGLAEKFLVCRP